MPQLAKNILLAARNINVSTVKNKKYWYMYNI